MERPIGLSIIVPAFNEERTICRVLCDLIDLERDFPLEIIVLNDGSKDDTDLEIMKPMHLLHVRYIKNALNQGKGNVVKQGILIAKYSHTLIFDADLEYFASDIPKMFSIIQNGLAQVVFGSRVRGNNTMQPSLLFSIGRNLLTLYINILFNSTITDLHTCLKLIPTTSLVNAELRENGFGLDTEITCALLKNDMHPFEVPITYIGRTVEQGKKIRFSDGIVCVKIVTKKRFARKKKVLI